MAGRPQIRPVGMERQRRRQESGKPRIIPSGSMHIPALVTWPQVSGPTDDAGRHACADAVNAAVVLPRGHERDLAVALIGSEWSEDHTSTIDVRVGTINAANRQTRTTPKTGNTLHRDCPT